MLYVIYLLLIRRGDMYQSWFWFLLQKNWMRELVHYIKMNAFSRVLSTLFCKCILCAEAWIPNACSGEELHAKPF